MSGVVSEIVAVTRLQSQRALAGTDLFCQFYSVVNIPGASSLWVGRIKPGTETNDQPEYETLEQAWLFAGEEYYSLEDLMEAWRSERSRLAVRDRMGEAMRRMAHGLVRPLWNDMEDEARERWRERADSLLRLMRSFGLGIILARGTDHG